MLTDKKISAIIACYKDGQAIPIMRQRLTQVFNKITSSYEIIFVNDGSPDDSEKVLDELAQKDEHIVAITHSRNFGSQNAFASGMEIATGDAVVLLDGDLQDPPEMIEKFVPKWLAGYDVVYGIREKREAPLFMQLAYKMFYRVFRKASYINIPLDAGDFSLIDKKVVEVLKHLPERDRFLRGLRAWVGFKQTGVAYTRPERMFGKSTNNLIKNINWAKKALFSFSYQPLEFIFYVALITFFISAIAIVFYLIAYFVKPDAPKGITTIIIIVLFLGSVQLLSLSIIGEYLGKIFEEVKGRPKFVVKKIVKQK